MKLDLTSQAQISELILINQKKSSPVSSPKAPFLILCTNIINHHRPLCLHTRYLCASFQLQRLHLYTVWPIVATTKNGRCRGGFSVHTLWIMHNRALGFRRLVRDANQPSICGTEYLNMTSVHSPGAPSSRKRTCCMFFMVQQICWV